MTVLFSRCVVVGTGLIGASLAGAGRRAGVLDHVTGVGRTRENLEVALAAGLVDEISTDLDHAIADADLVVLGTPVLTSLELLRRIVPLVAADAVICDVGSVKAPIVAVADELQVADRFVACHPMAGREVTGARGADPSLFDGAVVVVCTGADGEGGGGSSATSDSGPASDGGVAKSPSSAVGRIRALWEAAGASLLEMDAARHDEIVAFTSHLPQMLSWALVASVAKGFPPEEASSVGDLVGSGFRDLSRIASSDAHMWAEIAVANGSALDQALGTTADWLTELRAALSSGDVETLVRMFEAARRGKEDLLR